MMSSNNMKNQEALARARSIAKEVLGSSTAFRELPTHEQMAIYKHRVEDEYNQLTGSDPVPVVTSMAKDNGLGKKTIVDDSRFENKHLDKMADRVEDLIEGVDFPNFVSDLVTGVFDGAIDANIKQMEAYQDLLKEATKSLSEFIKNISPEESFAYLAENNSDDFGISFPDMDDGASDKIILTDKDGNPVDTEDTRIKAKIMEAKLKMGEQNRATLMEVVKMGVQRLVIEEGHIKAGMNINISTSSNVMKSEKGRVNRDTKSSSWKFGLKGNPFGKSTFGMNATKGQTSQIRLSTASGGEKVKSDAKIDSEVMLKIKSDFFPLKDSIIRTGNDQKQQQGTEKT